MMVYGDPSFEAPVGELLGGMRRRLALTCGGRGEVDRLRSLVAEAGQVEQAVWDSADVCASIGASCGHVADLVAEGFVDAGAEFGLAGRAVADGRRADDPLTAAKRLQETTADAAPDSRVRVKVPEGYAFYALLPDQYVLAAADWATANVATRPGPVLVVGVRSIGTSLSAVVAATLKRSGWRVRRVTVRPAGAPFERRTDLSAAVGAGAPAKAAAFRAALVVDEGPGLSGSSMASVAGALVAAGIERGRIAFLPGHGGEPGHAAGETVREWWRRTARFWVNSEERMPAGGNLLDILRDRTAELVGGVADGAERLTGGGWRAAAFRGGAEWPWVCPALERAKYRVRCEGGRELMWKFAGLAVGADGKSGVEHALDRLRGLAERGWTGRPVGAALGFVAMPWAEGEPLRRSDRTPEVMEHIAGYLGAATEAPMPEAEQAAGLSRLREMLYWNTREALGARWAASARAWGEEVERRVRRGAARECVDARMAPHDWIRSGAGRLLKVGVPASGADHTVAGRQPLEWAVAAACVEWGLEENAVSRFVRQVAAAAGEDLDPALVAFHVAAYSALEIGVCSLARGGTVDPAELRRLNAAESLYRAALHRAIERHAPQGASRTTPPVLFTQSTQGP